MWEIIVFGIENSESGAHAESHDFVWAGVRWERFGPEKTQRPWLRLSRCQSNRGRITAIFCHGVPLLAPSVNAEAPAPTGR